MQNLEKWYRLIYLQSKNRDTDVQNKHGYQGETGGGMNSEIEMDIYIYIYAID